MNKGIIIGISFLVAGILFPVANAQNTWSLEDCIDYARQQNIQVQKSKLAVESSDIDIKQSKAALFPSLSGSIGQSFRNSQVDKGDDNYRYEQSFGGDYNLNASVTIFNGKRNLNNIKMTKLEKESGQLNTQEIQNNIEISITQAYLQMLYTREAIKNNENILESSAAQLSQTKVFLDAGSITRSEYAQVEAQYSADKYNLVLAQNSFDNYKLQLKQLLELDYGVDFDIVFPEIDEGEVVSLIPSKYDIYQTALGIMPEIENSKLAVDIANLSKSTAKAGYLPSISLNGSIGTSNIWNRSPSFNTQIGRNFAQSIGVTLSIPIFDNRQNKSNVQKAEIGIQTAKLDLIDAEKELLRTIESLYQDAVSSQSKYFAAKDKLESAKLSYELVREQYTLGMRNTVELTTEKNNYSNALQELLQAKYTALLSLKLLKFYQGQKITL